MELSSFSENIVTVPYVRSGETVDLSVNIDAFTPEFFRIVGERFTKKMKELEREDSAKKGKKGKKADAEIFETEARALEVNREIYADLLSNGVLVGWTVTENGKPVMPTKDILLKLPPRLVVELWNLCLEASKTVKKRVDEEIEDTSDSTHSGSMALRAV